VWNPTVNWQAQSSYAERVEPPACLDPAAAPLVCLSFSTAWLPYVIGALKQLVQPAAWECDEEDVPDILDWTTALVERFSEAGECMPPVEFQLTEDCLLQYSTDGGATFETVPGWTDWATACFTGPEGPEGPEGPAGGFTPGTPPPAPGQTTSQQACSIAGYIAQYVIQTALSSVVNGYNTGQTALEVATGILALIPGVDVVFAAITGAITLLYSAVTSGTIAEFTAAESDPVLLSDLTCAIFTATHGDGYVTAGNFADVQANIAAITYTYPDVISAISDWLDAFGYGGLAAAQIPGAYTAVDCSGCEPAGWCYDFDFTESEAGWSALFGEGISWIPGTGWQSSYDVGTGQSCDITITFDSAALTRVEVVFNAGQDSDGVRQFRVENDSGTTVALLSQTAGAHDDVVDVSVTETTLIAVIENYPGVGASPNTISRIRLHGTGTCPFGDPNC